MNFKEICINDLKKITDSEGCNYVGHNCFTLDQIRYLPEIVKKNNVINDIAIKLYYIFDGKIMELYEYMLSIRIVDIVKEKESFFLEETGKRSVEEIEANIIEKLDNTYYEVSKEDKSTFSQSLERYINYMTLNELEILETTRSEIGGTVKIDGLFYELI